jgi:NADPH2:quinone reductase
MRAIVMSRHGGPEVLEVNQHPVPDPGPGDLLIDVAAAGVNYRDVYEREGKGGYGGTLPIRAGVEGAGRIAAIGQGVEGFAVGDRVAWVAGPGSYAERVLVKASRAVHVPDGLDDDVAAAALLQGMTAQYLSSETYPVRPGDTVVVHAAAGGVGLLLTQMVKLRGGRVIGTTSSDQKATLAREAGADEVIGYEGFAERVRELTDGVGAAAVYDGVGKPTFDQSLASLRPRGIMVLFGFAGGPPAPFDPGRLAAGSLYLTRPGLPSYTRTRGELLARASDVFGWITEGKLAVRIGGRYAVEDAPRAHRDLETRRTTGKLLLEMRGPSATGGSPPAG